jgi:hypothetical protein
MKRKLLLPLIAAVLLVPWPIAYAYDSVTASNTPVAIQAADESIAPQMKAYGNAIGSVSTGELFRVDTASMQADTLFTLYLTNTDELTNGYRYMNLNIGIYVQTEAGQWEKIIAGANSVDLYLTMQGGLVSFVLPGGAQYKITVDKGCFYCYGGGAAAPSFNLDAANL